MSAISAADRPPPRLQQVVDLGDELHVAVLDPVVHHLDVVPGPARAHVGDARLAVVGLCGDGAEDGGERVPRRARAARHDRWSVKRAFLAARHAGAHEVEAAGGELVRAPIGVDEEGVAAVNQDVARFEMRLEVRDDAVDGLARRDHDENPPRALQHDHQVGRAVGGRDGLALRRAVHERLRLGGVEIVADDWKPAALDVAREIRAHHPESDHTH